MSEDIGVKPAAKRSSAWAGSYFRDAYGKRLLFVLVAVLAGSVVLGLFSDGKAFIVNIAAGVAGIVMAALFGLLVIDRYLAYWHERQWARVARVTLSAISAHLCEVAVEAAIEYGEVTNTTLRVFEGRDKPTAEEPEAYHACAEALREAQGPRIWRQVTLGSRATVLRKNSMGPRRHPRESHAAGTAVQPESASCRGSHALRRGIAKALQLVSHT